MSHPMNDWSLPELCDHYFDILMNFIKADSPTIIGIETQVVVNYLKFIDAIIETKLPSSFQWGSITN